MGGVAKATVVLARVNGLTEDAVVNSLYFNHDAVGDPTSSHWDALAARIASFYNDFVGPAIASPSSYISEAISRAALASRIDFFHDVGSTPPALWGSPTAMRSFTLDAATVGESLPAEVAAVLSFHGDLTDIPETAVNPSPPPATIRPAARRRGRIYIGPLNSESSVEDGTSHEASLSSDFQDALLGSASTLLAANDATWVWTIQSVADDDFYQVTGGYVDNAFDTQRRRGGDATLRTPWS